MIEVRDRGGNAYYGKSPQTIARRLYGRRASVRLGSTANMAINRYVEATVTTPAPAMGDNCSAVEATWLLDDDAVAAYERTEYEEDGF